MADGLRGFGVLLAFSALLGIGWWGWNAPAPDVHVRPLRDGGRIAGVVGWPLMIDIDGDDVAEAVFWRHSSNTLVALNVKTADRVWESAPVRGGYDGGHAWAAADGVFVSDVLGAFSGLNLRDGTQRFRRELGVRATSVCRRSEGLWVTLADDRTVAIDPVSGEDLGARPTLGEGSRLSECEPISGDRHPDAGHAKAVASGDASKVFDADAARALAPHVLPDAMSVQSYFYLPRDRRWVLAGHRSSGDAVPMIAQTGTRTAERTSFWAEPAAIPGSLPPSARELLVAVTRAAAFVAFPLGENDQAAVVAFDLQSGRRRWQVQVAPHTLAALAASAEHVVLTWSGGTPRYSSRRPYVLMVLDAATGERVTQLGAAAYSP